MPTLISLVDSGTGVAIISPLCWDHTGLSQSAIAAQFRAPSFDRPRRRTKAKTARTLTQEARNWRRSSTETAKHYCNALQKIAEKQLL
jgi:hypothetical protein